EKKHTLIKLYPVKYALMRPGINVSLCACGVYALKFIECHTLGLNLSFLHDSYIHKARIKIPYDLWKAVHDPVLIEQMSKYIPPKLECSDVVKIEYVRH
ncbi:hypothetical protein EUTSA_v10002273mg, partial [Eutrema salsugineum]